MKFIITEFPPREAIGYKPTLHVYAPPGYMRCEDGSIERDGSLSGGPEWGEEPWKAFRFETRRAAARVLSKCGPRARIVTLKGV